MSDIQMNLAVLVQELQKVSRQEMQIVWWKIAVGWTLEKVECDHIVQEVTEATHDVLCTFWHIYFRDIPTMEAVRKVH